jgi:Poly A polymerase head domain
VLRTEPPNSAIAGTFTKSGSGEQGIESQRVAVIKANPDQSKHLETATMHLHGLSLDLVNLRSETYSDTSRIPRIEIGTPLQDAERRDFTVNALFYNLQTRAMEDFTGQGLKDLKAGIIRTPLAPLVTFLDGALLQASCTGPRVLAPASLSAQRCWHQMLAPEPPQRAKVPYASVVA